MKDTSLIERKISDKVGNMCLEAIVSEAFIASLPIDQAELTEDLTHGFACYATECMKDLGSMKLLDAALESTTEPAKKAYLQRIKDVCMETATSVTERVIAEANDDEALRESAENVAMTEKEYTKFSRAAATLTPETLTKMIQKKTLDTINEEREAYKKDEELKNELVDALADVDEETDVTGEDSMEPVNNTLPEEGGKMGSESPAEDVDPDAAPEEDKVEAPGDSEGSPAPESFGVAKKISAARKAKAEKAFESYMRSMAGDNYRINHSSVFSKIQELAYEGLCATTESYEGIPFDTMTAITKENTFGRFKSNGNHDVATAASSIARYAFESAGVADTPADQQETLNNSLLVASIIYTFFETLNSMNLFCPKLDEIRTFVDENLPIEGKVLQDKSAFMNLFNSMISSAKADVQKATSEPELDHAEGKLDIVREKAAAPGFESMRVDIDRALEEVTAQIASARAMIVKRNKRVAPAIESMTQTMQRTRDTLKFSRVANTMARKPNVASVKCKVDPQASVVNYVGIECFTADNQLAGTSKIVLESALNGSNVVDYVTAAINASSLMDIGKPVVMADRRSGKVYMDTRSTEEQ